MANEDYDQKEKQKYSLGALYLKQALEEGKKIEIPSLGIVINPKRKKLSFGWGHKEVDGTSLEGLTTATTSKE